MKIFKSIIFFILFLVLFNVATLILPGYWIASVRRWEAFYNLKKNTLDAIFMGSSHAACTFNQRILNSYNTGTMLTLASPGQDLRMTHDNLTLVFEKQSPRLVAVELFSAFWYKDGNMDVNKKQRYNNIDGVRFSPYKIKIVMKNYTADNRIYALFPLIRDHGNWKKPDIIKNNIELWKQVFFHGKSFFTRTRLSSKPSSLSYERIEQYKRNPRDFSVITVHEEHLSNMKKIVELCRYHDTPVIFVMAPFLKEFRHSINYESYHRGIAKACEDLGVEFIDYNLLYDDIALTAADFLNEKVIRGQHTNQLGAKKVCNHLIPYIQEKYFENRDSIITRNSD